MRYASRLLLLPVLALTMVLAGCDSGSPMDDEPGPGPIDVPATYTFQSRFVDGESAVAYPGQVTRNLLIADLKFQTDALGQSGASSTSSLLRRYTENSETLNDLDVLTPTTYGFEPLDSQQNYGDIATGKSLQGKATSSYASDKTLIGSGELAITGDSDVTADELIQLYLNRIQSNSQDDSKLGTPSVYTTDDGVNMSQVVNKLLLGSVAYSQGTEKYLDDVLNTDTSPNTQDGENPYSTLGHVWDEAYGYYGAARDFNASGAFYDSDGLVANFDDRNGDGRIDLASEFVYTWADYSVDRGTVNDIGFHTDLFQTFREGRTAIINQESIDNIRSHAADARATWDKLVAANVVHYLNSMAGDLSGLSSDEMVTESNLGEDAVLEYNEHWGEAKPFAWALQYNPDKQISAEQLQTVHAELGASPPYGVTKSEVISRIDAAKGVIENAYGFPDANMDNW